MAKQPPKSIRHGQRAAKADSANKEAFRKLSKEVDRNPASDKADKAMMHVFETNEQRIDARRDSTKAAQREAQTARHINKPAVPDRTRQKPKSQR